ncbi:MAG TPA: hypothetical protein DCQ29_01420, partial [Chitinophagaceae bacterium]|nr:hypothetical protein [Chitinophagaceae bacterium]
VANEISLNNYQIERSFDGVQYSAINSVLTNGSNSYKITDANVFASSTAKKVYYRIKAVNNDGSYTYSKTVVVQSDKDAPTLTVNAYPNPFIEQLQIKVVASTLAATTKGAVVLRTMNGNIVKQQAIVLNGGVNLFNLTDVQSLSSGKYILSVYYNNEIVSITVQK